MSRWITGEKEKRIIIRDNAHRMYLKVFDVPSRLLRSTPRGRYISDYTWWQSGMHTRKKKNVDSVTRDVTGASECCSCRCQRMDGYLVGCVRPKVITHWNHLACLGVTWILLGEQKYTFQTEMDGEAVTFEIFDTAGQESEGLRVEENIRWADAFILAYSTTDRCSFDECTRLRFLINYAKKPRRVSTSSPINASDIPVFLVGNKSDLEYDRMVSLEDGQDRSQQLLCSGFHDISVRENYEQTAHVFHEIYKFSKQEKKSRLSRSISVLLGDDSPPEGPKPIKDDTDASGGLKRKQSVSKRLMRRVMYGSSRSKDSESSKDDT